MRDAFAAYSRAVADGDGAKACAAMTEEARQASARPFGGDCEKVVVAVQMGVPQRALDAMRNPEITSVKITGDTTTATIKNFNGTYTQKLRRVSGRWLVDNNG